MGGGPDDPVVPSWIEPSGALEGAPADPSASDSMAHDTSEVPVVTELYGASSQSPRPVKNDAVGIESHENTEVDDTEDDAATVTSKEQDSANVVAKEVQTVKADKQNPQLDPETMIKQPESLPISPEQLVAEVKIIYTSLVMVETKCIEVDHGKLLPTHGPLDVTKYLLMIPRAKLILLQDGRMRPEGTVRTWYIKVQKDATKGYKKPSTPESTKNLPATSQDLSATPGDSSTTPKDCPTTPEEDSAHPPAHSDVSEKTAPQVGSPEDYLRAFQVALELRAKEHGWPEYEQLAAVNAAEIGEEDRKKVIDGKYYLDIGYDLVDQLLRDLETAKTKADAVVLDEKTKSGIYVDLRPLHDKNRYRKVGREWWVRISGQWVPSLSGEQYAAVVALHRTCLHEHHDFFLASQHPSASRALRRVAEMYGMPARMWKHAIHSCLEVLRHRLPESQESMKFFLIMVYGLMTLLDETVPRFRFTWIECKADLARYGMAVEDKDMKVKERWSETAKEEYTRVVVEHPTVGRLYHHLAILVRARSSSFDASFDAIVSRLFYLTKSLIVKTPFYAARESVLTIVKLIVDRNKKAAEKPASVPQTDQDYFLTAVVHLILASLEPETLRKNGYKDSRKDHIQAVYAALEKIKVGGPVKMPRIRPSAQVGLLLCQLLLGIPLVDKRWSPMMAAWAPDLVTAEDRADSAAMANARDIHDATIELISTMVPYLLEDADTRDLRVWEFIYVILVFMRSLKTRPALLKWLGPAFHAEMLPPYLNMLLREDETRGRHAFESASQSELVTVCSPLNERTKPGKYGLSTEDNVRKYHCEQEEKRKAESAESTATVGEVTAEDTMITPKGTQTTAEETMATTEETTTSDTAHEMDGNTKTPGSEQLYANVLPEHFLLSGLPFAREADPEPRDKPLENPTEEVSLTDSETDSESEDGALTDSETDSESEDGALTDPESENEAVDENLKNPVPKSEIEAQEEHQTEREAKEAEEAEVRRQEGLLRDPPLFPNGWLKKSKYDFDEIRVCDYVQSFETYNDRSNQILRLAVQLSGDFFIFESDEEKRIWISVSGASSVPKPDPNKKMPEIVERDGGVRVVYVDPSSHAAEGASEAVNIPAGAPGTVSEDGDDTAISAFDMALRKAARAWKAITAAEKPSSTHDAEPTEAEAEETTLPVQDVNDSQDTKRSDAGPDAGPDADAAAASADDQAAATVLAEGPVTDPQASVELTKDVLNKIPMEKPADAIKRWRDPTKMPGADKDVDEDGWTHVSDESHEDAETEPTVETAQVETRSMISRLFFRQ